MKTFIVSIHPEYISQKEEIEINADYFSTNQVGDLIFYSETYNTAAISHDIWLDVRIKE